MATGFSRRRGRVVAGLEPGEVRLLDALLADVDRLLTDGVAPPAARTPDPLAVELGLTDLDLADPDAVVTVPQDPAVARLLPAGTADDPELAADFRRLTDGSLRRRKVEGVRLARRTLGTATAAGAQDAAVDPDAVVRLRLEPAEAQAWVVALTDLRLVLAERLGIRTDDDAEALHARLAAAALDDDAGPGAAETDDGDDGGDGDDDDAGASWISLVYDFVSWLQETLTEALMPDLPSRGDGRRTPPPGT